MITSEKLYNALEKLLDRRSETLSYSHATGCADVHGSIDMEDFADILNGVEVEDKTVAIDREMGLVAGE